MRKSNLAVSAMAAGALVLGTFGMAGAHATSHTHAVGLVGEDASLTTRQIQGTVTRLTGKVDAQRNITLSDTTLSSGRYKIVVHDRTHHHNWHLFGNGQSRRTTVHGKGRWVFHITLSNGTYTVRCDVHQTTMIFFVTVS